MQGYEKLKRLPDLTIRVLRWVYYKKHELLPLREHLGSSKVFSVFMLLIFLVFCIVFFV